ncbi:MAG: 6-bladed beta-propeller [Bacteroidia bacterium]|nr:6-bladed beta-propeller [Bacteroidia bacterium]
MKRKISFGSLFALMILLLFSCQSTPTRTGIIEMVSINGKEIPKINLGEVDDSATTIKLSDLFEDFQIIPLETGKECLISYPGKICLTGHSILTWTQVGMGPCRVLEFGLDGTFRKGFGGGGKGPGEHGGYFVDELSWYPVKKEIFISFAGMGPENQLFAEDGKYLGPIVNPVELISGLKRFNDTIWMTPCEIAGHPEFRRDSIRLILFQADGREVKVWPRTIYPPSGKTGYSPTGWGSSLYQYDNQWRIYSPGDDTLYEVGPDRLVPLAILDAGPKGRPYNQVIDPSAIIGKCSYRVIRETEHHWYLDKNIITMTELQGSGNNWGGMFDISEFLLVIDKRTGEARNLRFEDDFLGLTRKSMKRHLVSWTDKGEPYLAFIAVELKESIKTALNKENLDPKIRARLEELDRQITVDSNPIIVLMKTKGDL